MRILKYVHYILRHKWFVFLECCKIGLVWRGLVHDLSKFSKAEFMAYANKFYPANVGVEMEKRESAFSQAWMHHIQRNPHHWNNWVIVNGPDKLVPVPMPKKYVKEMIADWRGMARNFGDTALSFYEKKKHEMVLADETRELVEQMLKED